MSSALKTLGELTSGHDTDPICTLDTLFLQECLDKDFKVFAGREGVDENAEELIPQNRGFTAASARLHAVYQGGTNVSGLLVNCLMS